MSMSIAVRLSAAGVVLLALTASTNASAAKYWAEIQVVDDYSGNPNNGIELDIKTNVLHSTCNSLQHDYVTHEMWYGVVPDGQTQWVEVGFVDGADRSGGCVTQQFFWADMRPGNNYNLHYPSGSSWSLGSVYALRIEANALEGCAWDVAWAPFFGTWTTVGTSTSNCPGSGRYMAAGLETSSQTTGSAQGWLTNWWEKNGAGTWISGWDVSPPGFYQGVPPGQPFIKWITSNVETEETLNEGW